LLVDSLEAMSTRAHDLDIDIANAKFFSVCDMVSFHRTGETYFMDRAEVYIRCGEDKSPMAIAATREVARLMTELDKVLTELNVCQNDKEDTL